MARLIATNWEEIWSRDEFQVYGSVTVQTTGTGNQWMNLGVCVGVPDSEKSTARAAGSLRGLIDVWFNDSSDWGAAPHTFRLGTEHAVGQLALEAVRAVAVQLFDDAEDEA